MARGARGRVVTPQARGAYVDPRSGRRLRGLGGRRLGRRLVPTEARPADRAHRDCHGQEVAGSGADVRGRGPAAGRDWMLYARGNAACAAVADVRVVTWGLCPSG